MSKRNSKPADIKRRLNDEVRDVSPFSSIVLKEKKEEPKKPAPKPRKKPSEIVQGYNPNASFADILFSYEHTGNPYSMPESKKKKIAEKKTDFGSILAKWEGTDSKNITKSAKKSEYKPTRSFEDILSQYEGAPVKKAETAKKAKKAKPEPKAEPAPYERKSPAYKASKDFGEILSSFEHVPEKKPEVKARDNKPAVTKAPDKPLSETLFREDSEWERDPAASWSVLGGNDSFVRPEPKAEEKTIEEKPAEARPVQYQPKKDFSEILMAYEQSVSERKDASLSDEAIQEKEEPAEEGTTLFIEEREGEKRAPGAAWSVFGGNDGFKREEHADLDNLPEITSHDAYKPTVDFSDILKDFENSNERTFEDIIREKGETAKPKAQFTINQLRLMNPQATLDLHQLTQSEAESAVRSFLSECTENGIRKISIITGKGLHSEDGIGVLKAVTERILDESGLVSEKKSAPQNAGGSGALWIILKA